MNIIISVEAEIDLENIWLYTLETLSLEQAERYLRQIFDEINYISKKPDSGEDFGYVRKGYFKSRVKMHFIFYKVHKNKKNLQIIRILHQQMDIENHLEL